MPASKFCFTTIIHTRARYFRNEMLPARIFVANTKLRTSEESSEGK